MPKSNPTTSNLDDTLQPREPEAIGPPKSSENNGLLDKARRINTQNSEFQRHWREKKAMEERALLMCEEGEKNPTTFFTTIVDVFEYMQTPSFVDELPPEDILLFEEESNIFRKNMRKVLNQVEKPNPDKSTSQETIIDLTQLERVYEKLDVAADALSLMFSRLAAAGVVVHHKRDAVPFYKSKANTVVRAFDMFAERAREKYDNTDKLSTLIVKPSTADSTQLSEHLKRFEEGEALKSREIASRQVVYQNWENSTLSKELQDVRPEAARQLTAEVVLWLEQGMYTRDVDEGIVAVAVSAVEQELRQTILDPIAVVLGSEPFVTVISENPLLAETIGDLSLTELLKYKVANEAPQLDILQLIVDSYANSTREVTTDTLELAKPADVLAVNVGKVRTLCSDIVYAGIMQDLGITEGEDKIDPNDSKFYSSLVNLHRSLSNLPKLPSLNESKQKLYVNNLNTVLNATLKSFEQTVVVQDNVEATKIEPSGTRSSVQIQFNTLKSVDLDAIRCVGSLCLRDEAEALGTFPSDFTGDKYIIKQEELAGAVASTIVRGAAIDESRSFNRVKYSRQSLIELTTLELRKADSSQTTRQNILSLLE